METGYGLTGWRSKLCLALLLFIHAFGATAEDDHGVTFLFPNTTTQSDLTLYYMDTVNVSYISPFPSPNLYTFCNSGKTFIRVQDAAPFNGSTFVLLNFTSTTPCYFNLRPGTEAGHGRNSDKFTLSPNQRSQTTVGLPQSSATSTSTASTTSATSSASGSVTSTPSSVPNSSGSSGLSAGAKAGIGIGVALGVIALACVAGFLVLRRRKRQGGIGVTGTTYEKGDNDVSANNPGAAAGLQPSQHSGASPYSEVEGSKYWQQPPPPSELNAMTSSQEMGVQRGRHELPG